MGLRVDKRVPQEIHKHIEKLETAGYVVKLWHHRNLWAFTNYRRSSHKTIMRAGLPDGRGYIGCAWCSTEDQFDKAKGTQIAFNRMIHSMSKQLGRDTVKQLLED